MNLYHVIKKGLVTEKATQAQTVANQYYFSVDPKATKNDIKLAVETLFKVDVTSVKTMNYMGKSKKAKWNIPGRRVNWKKAVVTLKEGNKIDLVKE